MSSDGLDRQVTRLNKKGFQVIDTEWEVAVLNAFSKVGVVNYEPPLSGSSKLDMLFTHEDGSELLADIATVSDEGREKETGVRAFEIELTERLRKAGLLYRGWSLAVGSHPTTKYGEQPRPALPPRSEFAKEIFNANFKRFLALELRPFAGGGMVSSDEIRISASAVSALLAGLVTQDELFEKLGFKPTSTRIGATRNPFEYQLSRKALIERVNVEPVLEDDETYLTFRFDGPDPARSPFRNPKKN